MIDTEVKQLQAIEDLYGIVKAQPKYKLLKEPNWKAETPPIQVLTWLLRKLGPLAKGNRWMIDTYQQGKKTRYCLVVWKNFYSYDLKYQEQYLPLDFLPALKKRDQPLHDLIIDTVALVSKCNKIPLWDEDGDFSEQLDVIRNAPIRTGNTVLDRQIISYTNGPAAEYLRLIKRRRRQVTVKGVKDAITAYNDNSDRKGYMKIWLRKGIDLAADSEHLGPWNFTPHHVAGNPISPDRQYKFIWSGHTNDVVFKRTQDKMKRDAKIGDFYPVMYSITKPGAKVLPLKIERYAFPTFLSNFMDWGERLIFHRYREYFIKDQYKKQETPAETLLEVIERMELEELEIDI